MPLKYTKSTDAKEKITLTSSLVYAEWQQSYAPVGQTAAFEIGTLFVGQGAPIEAKGKSKKGKSLGTVKGKVRANKFIGEFTIPADTKLGDMVYFEVKLPKNGLSGTSNQVAVVPPIKVTDFSWSASEARRGDILTLKASVENLPDAAQVKVIIYEFDRDGAHDKIVELPATVQNKKIELQWAYEYHEDTDEIPSDAELQRYGKNYNPPEYFFTVRVDKQEFGKKQESGLLEFKDWLEMRVRGRDGLPTANEHYILTLPDGTTREGDLDQDGRALLEDLPPGPCHISVPNVRGLELST
ncbi:MAG: hypothetical protein E4G91_06150 [Candidatus Zixiibacteriota bacterium]|nr:MAG: hypothetical protein E4G91_06150 [candidate division Zixibacteria bacterium]